MTEQEWLRCGDPDAMLGFLKGKASVRKLRLFACACYHDYIRLIPERRGTLFEQWVAVTEQYAEGQATADEWNAIRTRLHGMHRAEDAHDHAQEAAGTAASAAGWNNVRTFSRAQEADHLCHESRLVRDVFGNPFRPVAFDTAWRTNTAVSLARQMYEAREFSAMPILADALQDAGCDSAAVLDHCRDPNQAHVRGCWVVDLVLGKG